MLAHDSATALNNESLFVVSIKEFFTEPTAITLKEVEDMRHHQQSYD